MLLLFLSISLVLTLQFLTEVVKTIYEQAWNYVGILNQCRITEPRFIFNFFKTVTSLKVI